MTKTIYKYSESIEHHIFFIRGMRVILDSGLSAIYGVKTKVLNQAVNRNKDRFPLDFAFQLKQEDLAAINNQRGMRSQIVTASKRNIRFLPFVFTEHGALMVANVLKWAAGHAHELPEYISVVKEPLANYRAKRK